MSGLRVTIPDPLGKKSVPIILSSTLDFPDDCEPTTAICGREMGTCTFELVITS